ncbi:MAG: tRNA (N(6)-L-threonylcarbamoyladenosine(37)-C(2))-methylthiotransferase MtaB [Actinobacteria bacterium]|nr:tRNA (N(6)-L-threonylcarbamoyladenosine(37)-C(2))-methylthiotransferase MtaB [Actinomycetota bacterium]
MPTVSFTTLGCRLNQAESDSMAEDLARSGVVPVSDGADPDVVVINTCTVTREATKASRMAIRRAIRSHPDAKVVVVGCYAVSDRDEVDAIAGVDVVMGNDDKERFADALAARQATTPLLQLGMRSSSPVTPRRVRANLKIQTGCDEWCSFCIIPTTRGPLRSLDETSLLAEARERVAAGARELVLTGVHLGKYTYDTGGDERRLVELFGKLLSIEGLWRVRLSSILSRHLTDELLAFMADEPRMCRYLHVPLQSGDDGVLATMNRPYRIADYMDAICRAKAALPGVALATDIIVGHPGETDNAFHRTIDVVREARFSKLHVFRYSARPGTAAAAMDDDVNGTVKRDRSKALIEVGNEIREQFLNDHLGRPLEVLVEDERIVDGASVCSGQTDDYVRAWFEAEGLLGKMVTIQAEEVRADGLRGARVLTTTRG